MSGIESLLGIKGSQLYDFLIKLQNRFPKFFPVTLLSEGSLSFLTKPFLDAHSLDFLRRFFFSWHRLIKKCAPYLPRKTHLKILETTPSVYGLLIALTQSQDDEALNQKFIMHGIHNLIPGIKIISDSYFSYQNGKVSIFYLEIKKMKGGAFSSEEKKKLSSELPFEFQQALENTPSLVLPENIEDLFKNISRLSQEIKYLKDLPQVMISFIEYSQKTLSFLVIVIRIVKPDSSPIETLSNHLPSLIQFSLEKVFDVGLVRKKYRKEAAVFTLEMSSSIFLRNNEVDLRVARQYIGKALESMLGAYRDYNGGFLNKENEQLFAIKQLLEKERFLFFPLFEEFFYNIKPLTMRVLISLSAGVALAHLFQKIYSHPLQDEKMHHLEFLEDEHVHLAILKTNQKEWKLFFPPRIVKHSKQIAWSFVEHKGVLYLFFFHQYPKRTILKEIIQKEIDPNHPLSSNAKNSILRLNFQGGDPPSLNPRLANDIRCHILYNLLFEGLTRINPKGIPEPASAAKIDIGKGGTSYTFYLRPSSWSNGEEVTAYHFEKAWKKAILDPPPFTSPDLFYPIKNVIKAKQKIVPLSEVGIVAKNAKTLHVCLESPCPHFLHVVATPFFAPLLGENEEPSQFNGPFILGEWKQDHYLHLSQNPYYWNAKGVKLGGIHISMIRDAHLFLKMFQEGELDLIGDPLSPLPPEILQISEIANNLLSVDISRIFWIHCNTQSYPLNNIHVRRALSLALNRKKVTDTVFLKQRPHASPLPPKYSHFQESPFGDIREARRHFRQGLEELKIDAKSFPSLVFTHSNLSFEKPLVEELKAQWGEALGISIVSSELPWNEFSAVLDRGEFQLGGLFRRDFLSHPMSYLSFFKNTQSKPLEWRNQAFEAYFNQFGEKQSLKKLEQILIEETPVIPLVNQTYFFLNNQRVKGIAWDDTGCLNLMEARIDEKNSTHFARSLNYFSSI